MYPLEKNGIKIMEQEKYNLLFDTIREFFQPNEIEGEKINRVYAIASAVKKLILDKKL